MKPNDRGIQVEGNLTGDKVAMSFHEDSLVHLMGVLTDLYSDAELAVIREYSTNARDSHVEAGVERPIEVSLPSALSPFLRVRDFGGGLSHEDIREIYSQYGASTKRQTNTQTGMLGLGCKSALTYTQQFTLVSVKDGRKVQVSISRDTDGAGSMTVVSDEPSKDEPGVEVVVPVKRQNDMPRKARQFFSYWSPEDVLIDGAPPVPAEGLKLSDRFIITRGFRDHKVVMGNVAYPAPELQDRLSDYLGYNYSLVAYVDIGEVDFTPSREALNANPKTDSTLDALVEQLRKVAEGAIQEKVDEATSPAEAVNIVSAWSEAFPKSGNMVIKYKNREVPRHLEFGDKDAPTASTARRPLTIVPRDSRVMSRHETASSIQASLATNTVWFHGYTNAKFSAPQKKRLMKWAEENNLDPERYILTETKPDSYWIDPAQIKSWDDIKKIKMPRNAPNPLTGRIPGSYDLFEDGIRQLGMPADQIDTTKPLFYSDQGRHSYGHSLLAKYHSSYTYVPLPSTRVAKFLRHFPKAIKISDEIERLVKQFENKLSKDEAEAITLHSGLNSTLRNYRALDSARVDDPEVKRFIRVAGINVAEKAKERRELSRFASLGNLEFTDPLDSYPLFSVYSQDKDTMDHVYLYLNAAYAARQEGHIN